ncbi:DUF3367 domain-containing protein [Yimella sp. cx-573]|nr:DUF3367 domain-containing protein [Yimella sp. cx-573]
MKARSYDHFWTALVALVPWLVQPGLVQPDTKVDLTISPWRYLDRSLSAWNPHSGLGELQNQAYGYLFPMGPVFGTGQSIGLPDWAVQRLWWTLLVVVAFLGCRRLIRRWEIAGPTAASIAAIAYALSPRVLTLLSDHSVEAWPAAVAPWIVLVGSGFTAEHLTRGARWTIVARIGLLTAALGGVNATASAAALLPAFILLLVHPAGRRRSPWFVLAVCAGALWWVLPLLVLGRYAYPFLAYIETASITTAVTSVPNTLRGGDNWIAYILDSQSHPVWQGGWVVAQSLSAIVLTCVIAALSALGVLRLTGVVRRFALVSVLVGTLAMTIGHPGVAGAPFAAFVQSLLDGPMVVLRNVHKLDLLIRLPFALGLATMLSALAHQRGHSLLRRRVQSGLVAALVACSMVPLWQGRVGSDASYATIPKSWTDAAGEIDRLNAAGGTTLLLPASRTASYTWGRSTDEPLSALARTPVVVRASAPLGNPVATRLLDAVDALAASGEPQPALAATLARMGVSVVVVRRDLAGNAGAGSWQQVEQTLSRSPGFTTLTGQTDKNRSLWTVDASAPNQVAEPVVMDGGAEAIPAALATGALPADAVTQLAADTRKHARLITDSLPWRVYANGLPAQHAYGPVLPAGDPRPVGAGSKDLPPVVSAKQRPHRELIGLRSVDASSSAADPFSKNHVSVSNSEFAAIDGDPATSWLTGDHEEVATLTLQLSRPTSAGDLVLTPATGNGVTRPARIELSSDGFGAFAQVDGDGPVRIKVPAGLTRLTVSLHAPEGAIDPVMGLSGIDLTSNRMSSVIAVPQSVDLRNQSLLLGADVRVPGVPARSGENGAAIVRRVSLRHTSGAPVQVWLAGETSALPASCGAAGSLTIGERRVPLRFDQPTQDGLRRAIPCTTSTLPEGTSDLRVDPPGGARAQHVLIGRPIANEGSVSAFVTTHGANDGWAGQQGGQSAKKITVDGWRQGYELRQPGAVVERFEPTTAHRVGLGVGALAVLLLGLLGWRTRRVTPRTQLTGSGGSKGGRWPQAVLAIGAGFLAAGPIGALLGACVVALPRRARGPVAAAGLILAGLALATGGVVDERAWGAAAGQVLGTITLVVLAAECALWSRAERPTGPSADARPAPWRRTRPSP